MLEKIPNSIKMQLINIPIMITLLTGCSSFALDKDKSEDTAKAKSCYFGLTDDKTTKIELDRNDNVHYMNIYTKDGMDYSYLNDMTSLDSLVINDISEEPVLNTIDGKSFKNKMNIGIGIFYYTGSFNEERYGFLKDVPYIDNLYLGSDKNKVNIDYEFLSKLKNVHNLYLGVGLVTNYKDIDLSHLDTLTIDGKVYDIALNFSNESLKKLEDSGVKVIIEDRKKVEEINNEVKDMYRSLGFKDTDSKQYKLNKIIVYILDKLTYDEGITKKQALGENVSDKEIADEFYKEGQLDAVFNNKTQVCGNYTALLSILCREAGIDSYNLMSGEHSWNAVKMDNGDYYAIDLTSLNRTVDLKVTDDDKKINDMYESGFGYLEDIASMKKYNSLYNELGIPEGLDTESSPRVSFIKDYEQDEKHMIKVIADGNRYYFPLRYGVYFLMGLGLAAVGECKLIDKKLIKKDKKTR